MFHGISKFHAKTFKVHCCTLYKSQKIPAIALILTTNAAIFQEAYPTCVHQMYTKGFSFIIQTLKYQYCFNHQMPLDFDYLSIPFIYLKYNIIQNN